MGSILNLPQIKRAHSRFLQANTGALSTELTHAREYGESYAKRYPRFIPRHHDGLREATKGTVVRRVGGGIVRLSNAKKYAAAIDQGARPHDIFPRHGNRLVFFWAKKNKWVRAKRVKHPGNKPYRFLHGATIAMGREFGVRMKARMNQVAKKF